MTSWSAHPVWSSSWPLGASNAQAAIMPMPTTIHDSIATASRPRGFGYSTRLTISHAVPRIASSVATKGSSSNTMDTTVSAPNGDGMPWKVPSLTVTHENRASRSTTASSTTIAPTAATRWYAPSATMP